MADPTDIPRRGNEPLIDDPTAAMDRLREFTHRIIAVPKSEIDPKSNGHKPHGAKKKRGRK